MALLSGRRFRRRKKEVLFVEGYQIDHANDIVPGLDRQDEQFHIFGNDSPETDVQSNYGTLQIGILDKETNNALLDLVTGQNPEAVAHRQYRVQDLTSVDVWMNVKNSTNTAYVKSMLFTGWTPGMPLPSGAPNDKAAYSVTGNSDLPRQFQSCWIDAVKVASGAANIGASPVSVPGETGVYALRIKALSQSGSSFEQEVVEVSSAMLTVAGTISWPAIMATIDSLPSVTHAYILFLQSGSGVYPSEAPGKLRA